MPGLEHGIEEGAVGRRGCLRRGRRGACLHLAEQLVPFLIFAVPVLAGRGVFRAVVPRCVARARHGGAVAGRFGIGGGRASGAFRGAVRFAPRGGSGFRAFGRCGLPPVGGLPWHCRPVGGVAALGLFVLMVLSGLARHGALAAVALAAHRRAFSGRVRGTRLSSGAGVQRAVDDVPAALLHGAVNEDAALLHAAALPFAGGLFLFHAVAGLADDGLERLFQSRVELFPVGLVLHELVGGRGHEIAKLFGGHAQGREAAEIGAQDHETAVVQPKAAPQGQGLAGADFDGGAGVEPGKALLDELQCRLAVALAHFGKHVLGEVARGVDLAEQGDDGMLVVFIQGGRGGCAGEARQHLGKSGAVGLVGENVELAQAFFRRALPEQLDAQFRQLLLGEADLAERIGHAVRGAARIGAFHARAARLGVGLKGRAHGNLASLAHGVHGALHGLHEVAGAAVGGGARSSEKAQCGISRQNLHGPLLAPPGYSRSVPEAQIPGNHLKYLISF